MPIARSFDSVGNYILAITYLGNDRMSANGTGISSTM